MTANAGIVTVDCGNSTIDCLAHATGSRRRIQRGDGAPAELRDFLRQASPSRVLVASVVPASLEQVREAASGVGLAIAVAGVDLPCPLRIDYDTPATLGVDRWLGCVAAHRLFGAAVVVDCGTATTVNAVDAEATFRGGPIGPGLRALVVGMAQATPALPAPRLDVAAVAAAARSTQAAVDAGVLLGYCGLVERLVTGVLDAMPAATKVVLTGGNADRFARHASLRAELVPDLVHRGLVRLAELAWND